MRFTRKLALVGVLALGCLFWTALTPQQILNNSAGFGLYGDTDFKAANTYLLATLAGVAINPANILSNAAAFGSYGDHDFQMAQTYLLSQITGVGGGIPGIYVTGSGTGTTNGDNTITINVTASGTGSTNVVDGTNIYTVIVQGNMDIRTNLTVEGPILGSNTGTNNLRLSNPSGQTTFDVNTNGVIYGGTNNQMVIDTSGNLTLAGTAHGIWGLHVDGSAVSNAVSASTTTAQNVFTNPWLAGNVTQTNGTYLYTNYTGAGKDWFLLSGAQLYGSNGVYQTSFTLNSTNLSLGGAAINSGVSFGGANGLSNSVLTLGGSNDITIRAGYQTNDAQFTNGILYINDATSIRASLGVGGPTVTSNSVTINGSNWVQGVQTVTGNSSNNAVSYFGANQGANIDASGYATFTNVLRQWTTKEADYVMWGTEPPCIGMRGAHKISLPGAATNIYRTWTIFNLGGGTNAITTPAGAAFWTNTGSPRGASFYSDGTNWWVTGGS